MDPARIILTTLDRQLAHPADIRLLDGTALILGYGMDRATEDADLLLDDAEFAVLVEERGFAEALEAANRELEPSGLYLSHLWGPAQQILTPTWRQSCRPVIGLPVQHLRVSVLGPLDLIVSKLCRADDLDMEDIRHVVRWESISCAAVLQAVSEARVPEVFADVFPRNRDKLFALLCETRF